MRKNNAQKQKRESGVLTKHLLPALMLSLMLAFNASMTIPLTAQAEATMVYVAPHEGKKYHKSDNCRGLNNATSIKKMRLTKAKNAGYAPCKICKPKQ